MDQSGPASPTQLVSPAGLLNVGYIDDENGQRVRPGNVGSESRLNTTVNNHSTYSKPPVKKKFHIQKWLVLLAALLCRMLSEGYAISMGVFFVEFLETFQSGRGVTVWAISLTSGIMYGAGIPTSIVVYRVGERVACVIGSLLTCTGLVAGSFADNVIILLVFFGITTGIGMSFIQLSYAVAVGRHFKEGRGAATAACELGVVIGGLVFPILLRFLIDTYGWRGAVLISAGVLLNMLPLGLLFVPKQETKTQSDQYDGSTGTRSMSDARTLALQQDDKSEVQYNSGNTSHHFPNCPLEGEHSTDKHTTLPSKQNHGASRERSPHEEAPVNYCDRRIWKSLPFVSYLIVALFVGTGYYFPYATVVDIGTTKGYGKTESTYLVTTLGLANFIGITLMAGLLKLFWKHSILLYFLNTCLMTFSLVIFPTLLTLESYETLVVAVALFGLPAGGLYGNYAIVVADILGEELYTVGFGFICSAYGLGMTVSAPIAAWVNDLTGDYELSFYIAGSICLLGVLVLAISMLVHRRKTLRKFHL